MESPFDKQSSVVVGLYLEPMLNTYCKTYQNVLTVSNIPTGPLADFVKRVHSPKLSEFQPTHNESCMLVLCRYPSASQLNQKHLDTYLRANDIPNVFGYLESNGYKILESLTNMSYKGPGDHFEPRKRLICWFRSTQIL
jgi:hypothetical protein